VFCLQTPLHFASKEGHAEVARVLIDAGAEVNAKAVSAALNYTN